MPVNPATLVESLARHSFGTSLFQSTYLPPAAPAIDTFTVVADGAFKSASLNGRSFSDIKVSHMRSKDFAHEYIPGFEEGGTLELDFHYNPTVLVALVALMPVVARTFPDFGRRRWQVTDSEGNYLTVKGHLHPPDVQYEEDQPIGIKARIKVSGKPTFTKVEA